MGIIIIICLLALDILSKQWAMKFLAVNGDIEDIKNFLNLAYLENRGAAFGILQNKRFFLITIVSLVIIAMIFYLIKYRPQSKLLRGSLYLIIPGAVGNLIDRVFFGFVVDFLQFHYKDIYYFPTFNVADILVVLGTMLMILYVLKGED